MHDAGCVLLVLRAGHRADLDGFALEIVAAATAAILRFAVLFRTVLFFCTVVIGAQRYCGEQGGGGERGEFHHVFSPFF